MAARADVDQWKRRTGLLQLRLSSIQEDADMYRMRCQLLQSEATRESIARQEAQVKPILHDKANMPCLST